jgi:hypothetical protein
MRRTFAVFAALATLIFVTTSCGGGSSSTSSFSTTPKTATVYMTGSDAPLPAVLSFQIGIQSITLYNGSTSVALVNQPSSIEFSRLLGLRTLLALNSVPVGTYTSATITLANPVISYLDITTTPTSVKTINGNLLNNTVTYTLATPLTVTENGLGGLHLHFDLQKSLKVDTNGQITGDVNPVIQMRTLTVNDDDATIDELHGSLISVNAAANTFVIQRVNGRQFTIRVDSNTNWDGTDTINTIAPPLVMEIAGTVQADGSILATDVQAITRDKAYLGGLVLNSAPTMGPANNVTILVREEIPVLAGIDVGKTTTLNLNSNTVFSIFKMRLPVSSFIFNSSQLVVGQRVSIGGDIDTSTTPASFDTRRVVLHRQGLEGVYVANSLQVTAGNNGSFQMNVNGLHGYLFGAPITIMTTNATKFRNIGSLSAVANTTGPIYAVGLLLKDPNTGSPVLVAGLIGQPGN